MHMADALLTPAVGATMWAATGAATVWAAKRVRDEADPAKVPLMGVTGAFVFAAQMINFQIPGTGSSGHLGGGLILAILLGPEAALLVMASVLTVQALFFADGGLLALGANIFNLGVFPAFIAYPLVYRRIVGGRRSARRLQAGAVIAAVVGLLLGAAAVVFQTTASGISALPYPAFLALMLPIHLAIGLVEGIVTAAVVTFVHRAQPEILERVSAGRPLGGVALERVLAGLVIAALLAGGALSWFASSAPDGLEWSIEGVAGSPELETGDSGVYRTAAWLQSLTAILPDYGFRGSGENEAHGASDDADAWPAIDTGTSVSGFVGGALTLFLAAGVGLLLRRRSLAQARSSDAA
jgi:cobalt/nickel transport system permease protein